MKLKKEIIIILILLVSTTLFIVDFDKEEIIINPNIKEFDVDMGDGVKMTFIWCPPGHFMTADYNSRSRFTGHYYDPPRYKIILTKGFWLGKYEVTQKQWRTIMKDNPSKFKGENLPVESMTRLECTRFIKEFSKKSGKQIELPTEMEWEYACRAGTITQWYFGSSKNGIEKYCNYADLSFDEGYARKNEMYWGDLLRDDGYIFTAPVGSLRPNPWGFYDMTGNVWELCRDYCVSTRYDWWWRNRNLTDPETTDGCDYFIIRGGSWNNVAEDCDMVNLESFKKDERDETTGLRVMCFEDEFHKKYIEKPEKIIKYQFDSLDKKINDKSKDEKIEIRKVFETEVEDEPSPGDQKVIDFGNGLCFTFSWCPPGEFFMGSTENERKYKDELPNHYVNMKKGFWMSKTEINQSQWNCIMEKNPSIHAGEDLPVNNVSYYKCLVFLKKVNNIYPGKGLFRLPDETEWEYACQAGNDGKYFWGDDSSEITMDKYCWYEKNANYSEIDKKRKPGPRKTGSKLPNNWGIYNMAGNVSEWCIKNCPDYSIEPRINKQRIYGQSKNLLKGGNWTESENETRSSRRKLCYDNKIRGDVGFRILFTKDEEYSEKSIYGREIFYCED